MPVPDAEEAGPDLRHLTLLVVGVLVLLTIGGQLLHPARGDFATPKLGVSLAAAYIGGLLAFLSPCSVAVVPGFFAYGFDTRGSLLEHTYVLYLGLSLVFVPLGFGASLVGAVLRDHLDLLVQVSAGLLILLGLLVLLDLDLLGRLVGSRGAGAAGRGGSTTVRAFTLGAFFGLATTSCTAPILAGITVLSVGAGLAPVLSMLLFLVFSLGIVTPVFLLAWTEDRTAFLDRLRGRTWTLELAGRTRRVHSSRALSGLALVALGVLLLATDGTRDLLGLYDAAGATDLYETLDRQVREALAGWPGQVLTLLGLGGIAAWWWRRRAGGTSGTGPDPREDRDEPDELSP